MGQQKKFNSWFDRIERNNNSKKLIQYPQLLMQTKQISETLLLKVQAFLLTSRKGTDPKEIQSRSAQLTNYTKQPGFINAAHGLLTSPNEFLHEKKEKEILLTSLLKDKFKYQFQSVEKNVELHYQQLCEIAHHLQNTTYAAYTNIALALAYTYLHLLGLHPYNLQTFLTPFRPKEHANIKLFNYYFKTLQYIATEIDNNKFVIDQLQRETAQERLIQLQLGVLHSLNDIAGSAFEEVDINKENILSCFQAWITVHYDPNVLNSLPNHVLFNKVLHHIQDEECSEGASNCLRSIIYLLKDPNQNKQIYETLSTCTLQILVLVDQSVKDMELDKAQEFMRIIADFSRKSTGFLIAKYDRDIDTFLKRLISHLQDDLLNTYQNLADFFEDFLDQLKRLKKEAIITIPPDIYLLLDPLYNALCYKCQLPSRIIKQLNQTDQSKAHHISTMVQELFHHREFTEQLWESIGELQGKSQYLGFVLGKIQGLNPQDKAFWTHLQIYLHSLIDAVKEYPTIDTPAVSILQIYLELASKPEPIPICVRRTFLRVFRSLITSPHKDPKFLYRIMCTAVSCFNQALLFSVAEKTFCRACEENKHIAANIFSEFGPVLQNYPHRQFIVKGLTSIMCSDHTLTTQYLHQALSFLFNKFKEQTDKARRKELMHSILAALKAFKQSPLAKEHLNILQQFMRDIWPFAQQILSSPQRLKDDEDADVERIVRIIKVIMRTLEFHFAEFLQELFATVLTAFQKHPICSYVYLVEVAVTVYSSNPAYTDYLRRLYSNFCEIAYQHMKKIQDIARFSYLLDDFMGMNKRVFLHNASIILSSGKLPDIIEICINVFMGCDIPRVAKAAYSFFQTIFMVYWRIEFIHQRNSQENVTAFFPKPQDAQHYQALKAFLLQKIEQIIAKMLEHLSSAPTEQTRDYILDALVSEVKGFTQENPSVWARLLTNISSEILVQKQKQRIVQMLGSLTTADFQTVRQTVKAIDKMLVLMNRRMVNADKRKTILF